MADVAGDLKTWSATAASNSPSTATTVGTGLAPNLQEIQKVVRQDLANASTDVASAGTCDIGAAASNYVRITGTTTITGLGTVSAGIWKFVRFAGALTLTQNATSLILPGAASITTVAGDVGLFVSEGSGNWRCLSYFPSAKAPGAGFASGTVMLFGQSAAPTGWTKGSTHDNKALRLTTGAVGSGGATGFTSVFGSGKTVGATTITNATSPAHTHTQILGGSNPTGSNRATAGSFADTSVSVDATGSSGSGGSHDHTLSLDLHYVDVILATKD